MGFEISNSFNNGMKEEVFQVGVTNKQYSTWSNFNLFKHFKISGIGGKNKYVKAS